MTLKSLLIAMCLLLSPLMSEAATIAAEDTIAGLSTEIQITDGIPKTTIDLTITNENGRQIRQSVTADNDGTARTRIDGTLLEEAGTYTILEKNNSEESRSHFIVVPDILDTERSLARSTTQTVQADGRDSGLITVTLYDKYDNALPYRPVALISSRAEDIITPLERETNRAGEQNFRMQTTKPGLLTLRAMDLLSGTMLDAAIDMTAKRSSSLTLQAQTGNDFDIVTEFRIIVEPTEMKVGVEAKTVTVSAIDSDGNIVQDYQGTIVFTTTDPDADVPRKTKNGKYQFVPADQGTRIFPLALRFFTPGEQRLIVHDETNNTIQGEAIVNVTGKAQSVSQKDIEITSHKDGQFINKTRITLEGKGPSLINIRIMGGTEDVLSETDSEGKFSTEIKLDPTHKEFTIRVQQKPEEGSADSGPLHLTLDTEAPEIQNIAFSPEKPVTGSSVLVIVAAEPKLKTVTMELAHPQADEKQEFTLQETTDAGTYQALFTPPIIGSYQPLVSASDDAGNTTEIRTMLTVIPKPLPKVKNVRAEAKGNAASLEWDATEEQVDGYRIYVGEEPQDFLYTLDTGRPTTKATVSGLQPGKTYYFSLTALRGEDESTEKSDPVKVSIVGLKLSVTEQDSSLLLEWPSLPEDLALSAFLLEFGTKQNSFAERRTLNGALRTFTLRDLLNGVRYFLRLTPVSLTGEVMTELAALGEGTPKGGTQGFIAGPSEPIPEGLEEEGPIIGPDGKIITGTGRMTKLPGTSETGLPPIIRWLAIAGTIAAAGYYWHRRKTIRGTAAFLRSVQQQYSASQNHG